MRTYNPRNIPLARQLRKNMTPWECKLWYEYLRTCPVRFQRQKAFGEYIADFYCAKAHLIIELDGSQHYTPAQQQADARRTDFFTANHFNVLRFTNLDIDKNFSGVCQTIRNAIQQREVFL